MKTPKTPQGLRAASSKTWTVDADRGKSAYALLNDDRVKPRHKIDVISSNQLGSMQYRVVSNIRGKKSLKKTYDPEDEMYKSASGGKRRTRKGRTGKRNTRKGRK
jgi:hypothetical protein